MRAPKRKVKVEESPSEEEDEEESFDQPPKKKQPIKKTKDNSRDDMMEFEGKMINKKDLKKVLKREQLVRKQHKQNMNKYMEDDTLDEELLKDSEMSLYSRPSKMP